MSTTEERSTWQQLRPGNQVLIHNRAWVVEAVVGGLYTLHSPALGKTSHGRPAPGGPVVVIYPGHPKYATNPSEEAHREVMVSLSEPDQHDVAVGLLVVHLRGELVAKSAGGDDWVVLPAATSDEERLKTHLLVMHDAFAGADEGETMTTVHRLDHHAGPRVRHVHEES